MLKEIVYTLLGVVVAAYIVEFALGLADDSKEPPRVRHNVPLIGHLLELMGKGTIYLGEVR